jgi:general secretion pathway protein I
VKTHRGFTLVELLVALTLFAVVGGTLLQLFHEGLRTARLAAAHTHAVFLARSKLTELQAYSHLQPGTLSGAFADGYQWQAVLSTDENTAVAARGRVQPLELRLTVSWGESGEQRSFSLHSLLLTRWIDS